MNSEPILDFSALNKLAEQKNLSLNAQKFIYLIWLGLTPAEISSANYNTAMRTVEWGDRTLFVKENKMAECLAADGGRLLDKGSISSAETELEKVSISADLIYKTGFFNMRFEQSELGQPEDIVRIKEMSRHIGISADELDKEYKLYCSKRKA
ncbi:hypothetical protein [Huintestinicola sp.]|uniref:hypothetical protein n=1 Tax=Huintestinicola sp. TaxID=2981661 RepID=UPI003D7E41A8